MDHTSFDDEEVLARNLVRSRARVAQIRRRRRLAASSAAASLAAIACVVLVVRDPATVELETGDPRPTTTISAPTSVPGSIPPSSSVTTTTAAAPTTAPPTTQTQTTIAPPSPSPSPSPSPVPMPPAPPTTTFTPSAFHADATLARTQERLLAVGDGWVEVEDLALAAGRKRLQVAPDARLAMLVASGPCCTAITVASLDDLEIGASYWLGNSNPSENFHYPIGEPIREIVELIPSTDYEGMALAQAGQVAADVQGLLVKSCDMPACYGDWQYGASGSLYLTLEDGVVIHATYPGW